MEYDLILWEARPSLDAWKSQQREGLLNEDFSLVVWRRARHDERKEDQERSHLSEFAAMTRGPVPEKAVQLSSITVWYILSSSKSKIRMGTFINISGLGPQSALSVSLRLLGQHPVFQASACGIL